MEMTFIKENRKVFSKKTFIGIFITALFALACFFAYRHIVFVNRVHTMINITNVKEKKVMNGDYEITVNYSIPKNSEIHKFFPKLDYSALAYDDFKSQWELAPTLAMDFRNRAETSKGFIKKLNDAEYFNFGDRGPYLIPFKYSGTLVIDNLFSKEEADRVKNAIQSANSWSDFLSSENEFANE